ncbi:hypothetical protein [uncultured Kordia sp.]|uniref:hypothetical protein n=1 Tax=uncultured Kordia sp. TaxID=507699 RepID=UPI00262584E4|nr:hypothetical protein [uncultured Kordia sp.]
MNSYQEKTTKHTQKSVANSVKHDQASSTVFQFEDNRPEAIVQLKMKELIEKSSVSKPLIQRKIRYNNKTKVFYKNSKRPAWRKYLKDYVVDSYNTRHGTTYTSTNIKLKALSLDRCHKISFSNIQDWIIDYLNGKMTKVVFRNNTNQLYNGSSVVDKPLMEAQRDLMFKGVTDKQRLDAARTLLSLLNSATGNVELGDASLNRSIGKQLDVNFKAKGSKQSLTPTSRRMLNRLAKKNTSGIALTPGKSSVKSSHVGTSVSISNTTPKTKKLIKKHIKD